jgi:hypothetical protein
MEEKAVERVAEIACDRYQDEIGVDTMRWKGINETMRGYWRAIARAVLSATSYSRGYADAVRDAVEATRGVWSVTAPEDQPEDAVEKAEDAIRSLAKEEQETHDPDAQPRYSEIQLQLAMESQCTCGGMGPEDPGVCSACMVWHDLHGHCNGNGEAKRASETHEERWAAAGWHVEWSDEARCYLVCRRQSMWSDERTEVSNAPTVQAVDAWIAAHGKDKTP